MLQNLKIAMYLRLSKEDERIKIESNSIRMQRLLIMNYVRENFTDYELEEFVDDGFTGTNFNRPGMIRLLEKAREGKIDCVIVKDFSRFARDYIELGSYIEQIFPFLNVRFISINDKYDSESNKGKIPELNITFNNLLYDFYSKDISQKVSTSLAARKAEGQYLSANSPFGYRKDPEDRHRLIRKEDEAEIVRRIFDMTLQGKTINQIAKTLNAEGIKTPIEFKIEMGETSRTPKGGRFQWNAHKIDSILRNRIYVGDMVYGKSERNHVGGKNVIKPKKEWKIFHDHHEAIVSRELFEEIQLVRKKEDVLQNRTPKSVLQGKAVCSKCKKSLTYRAKKDPYFTCQDRYSTNDQDCCCRINVLFLEQAVLYELEHYLMEQGVNGEQSMQEKKDILSKMDCIRQEIETEKIEHDRIKKLNYDNYQSYLSGKTKKFMSLTDTLSQKSQHIKELEEHEMELQEIMNADHGVKVELRRELIEQYIECILVKNDDYFEIIWRKNIE